MARKFARLFLALGALGLTLGPRLAVGQSVLERLEARIRQSGQSGQSDKAASAGQSSATDTAAASPASGQALPAPPSPPPPPTPSPDSGPLPAPPQTGMPAAAGAAPAADRPYLGIFADDREDRGRGVRVLQVYDGGPGAKAGLQARDLITGVAAMPVRQMSELGDILELYKPGDKLAVEVQRDGQTKKLEITLGHHQAAAATTPAATSPTMTSPAAEPPRMIAPAATSTAIPPPPTAQPPATTATGSTPPPALEWPRLFKAAGDPNAPPSVAAAPGGSPAPYSTIPQPPAPYPNTGAPSLLPMPPNENAAADAARMVGLERRVSDLELRVSDLERLLREKAKNEPPPRPRLFNRGTPRPPEKQQ